MWLYWEDGFLMWLKTKYMLLMLYVNMNVSVGSDLVCYATIGSLYNYVVRILGYHSRRLTILICSGPFKIWATQYCLFVLHRPSI